MCLCFLYKLCALLNAFRLGTYKVREGREEVSDECWIGAIQAGFAHPVPTHTPTYKHTTHRQPHSDCSGLHGGMTRGSSFSSFLCLPILCLPILLLVSLLMVRASPPTTTTLLVVGKTLLQARARPPFSSAGVRLAYPSSSRSVQMSASSTSPPHPPPPPRPEVIVVTGPTAIGKSNLALTLCRDTTSTHPTGMGEIISVDSVQVYRGLDIGSNKPSLAERAEIPHHLLDVLDANSPEAFTAGDFVRKAEMAIDDVLARGKVPVVVGGTSMYTQWLVQGRPDAPRSDPRVELQARGMLAPFQASGDWEVGFITIRWEKKRGICLVMVIGLDDS